MPEARWCFLLPMSPIHVILHRCPSPFPLLSLLSLSPCLPPLSAATQVRTGGYAWGLFSLSRYHAVMRRPELSQYFLALYTAIETVTTKNLDDPRFANVTGCDWWLAVLDETQAREAAASAAKVASSAAFGVELAHLPKTFF